MSEQFHPLSRRTLIQAQIGLATYLVAGKGMAQDKAKIAVKPSKVQERKSWEFDDLSFDNKYSGARLSEIKKNADGSFHLLIEPETKPINPSQWYGFRITVPSPREITLEILIDYIDSGKQMKAIAPRIKNSKLDWVRLSDDKVTKGALFNSFKISLEMGENFFAPFEPYTLEDCSQWMDKIKAVPGVKEEVVGQSLEGRPLRSFTLNAHQSKKCLFIMGGQHPPEMTGNMGLTHYVEEILADNPLANKFREKFALVILPMVNPDGKFHGHWRCNLGGIDTNRDWDNFSQNETVFMRDYITKTNSQTQIEVFIDFHSVFKSLFYVEPKEAPESIKKFTQEWLGKVDYKMPGFKMPLEIGSPGIRNVTSKGWAINNLKKPSYVREFGYWLTRDEVKKEAVPEVLALMRYLLSQEV